MSKRSVITVILASFFSIASILFVNTGDVLADNSREWDNGQGNAEAAVVGGQGGRGGLSEAQINASVVNTRNTGAFAASYSSFANGDIPTSMPDVKVGSVVFEGTNVPLDKMDASSTVYVYTAIATKDSTVQVKDSNGNWVDKQVKKDEVMAYIPLDGGNLGKLWGLSALGGGIKNNVTNIILPNGKSISEIAGASVLSDAAMAAIYNRLVADGTLIYLDNVFTFNDFIKKILEELTEEELKELCKDGCCDTECPPPTPKPGCHDEDHWGHTEGTAKVRNSTVDAEKWVDEVWARPGDTIQFEITYCWGAQAVAGDDYDPARTEYWTGKDAEYFQLTSSEGLPYLFGENGQEIGLDKHILSSPHKKRIGPATLNEVKNSSVDKQIDFKFWLYLPGEKDGEDYTCIVFDFLAEFYVGPGYQVPGLGTGGCNATGKTSMSDVGKHITEGVQYDEIQAWQLYTHMEQGECDSCCPYDDDANKNTACSNKKKRNNLDLKSDNIKDDPFESLSRAQQFTGHVWGLVDRVADDLVWHYEQCDTSDCGCKKLSATSGSCTSTEKDGVTIYSADNKEVSCKRGQSFSYAVVSSSGSCSTDHTSYCTCTPSSKYVAPKGKRYTEDISRDIHAINAGQKNPTATAHIPYSFRTATSTTIAAGDVVYLGESVQSTFTVNIKPRIVEEVRPNEPYATLVDGKIQAVEFITATLPNGGGAVRQPVQDDNLCNYFGGDCKIVWEEGGPLNPEGRYNGKDYFKQVTRAVPDDKDSLVGQYYCAAVGISHTDSHASVDDPDQLRVKGFSELTPWRISGIACRTIAKKPSFQVWNGGIYTNGSISTSLTNKKLGTSLLEGVDEKQYKTDDHYSEDEQPIYTFGSWEEYFVVARGKTTGFASGAALGYSPASLVSPGGITPPISTYCRVTKKTISNTNCKDWYAGESGVKNTSQDTILNRLLARYAPDQGNDSTWPTGTLLNNGARYIYQPDASSTVAISSIVEAFQKDTFKASDPNMYNCNNYNNDGDTLKMCKGVTREDLQTTSNYASSTLIIRTEGIINIDRNICYGNGNCTKGYAVSLGNNSEWFDSMYGLPQILIIAKKGIEISKDVTQIDSWLITEGGINTCSGYSVGDEKLSTSNCGNTLMVNGPVFAGYMKLNRTAGANANKGPASYNNASVLNKKLGDAGSAAPAEIFNVRPDALYWAYSQAQRFTQATVTYTRELAPRY